LPQHGQAGSAQRLGEKVGRGKSAPVTALFYSPIESAKLAGVEPRGYLREATLRAVRNPGTVTLARDFKSSES
jgi:hypothetical protein